MKPQNLDMWQREETVELWHVTDRRKLQNFDMWQREGNYRTFTCGREKETTELLYVAERRRLQNLYMWQREGDYRTFTCDREKETTELLYVAERRRLQNFYMWQREGDYRTFGAGGWEEVLGGLSHLLCRPQRHSSRAARPGIPTSGHTRLIPHRGPAPRGPQETSDRWRAAIRRRHCTAAESLRWCSEVPVLFQHTQDTTYYSPCRSTMLAKPWIRLSERPPREQAATTSLHQSPTWTFWCEAKMEAGTPRLRSPREYGMKSYRSWDFFMQRSMRMRVITDDAMEVHFGLRLLDRAAGHASCHNYHGVNQARELRRL